MKGINLYIEIENIDGDLKEVAEIAERIKGLIWKNENMLLPNEVSGEEMFVIRTEVYSGD